MKRAYLAPVVCLLGLGVLVAQAVRADFLDKSAADWQKELSDPDAKVRRSAAFALGRLGVDARSAVPALVQRLREDSEARVRDMAASALGDIAKALKGDAGDVWRDAAGTLVNVLKKDEHAPVRRSAAYALGTFGPPGAGAAPALRQALGDQDASVRQNAAWALGQIGERAAEAVEALCACLRDKDVLVRRDAADALGSMGKDGAAGVAPLIDLAKSEPDDVVRTTALNSLSYLAGPEHKKFAPGLTPLLEDKNPEVSLKAAIVLAHVGGDEAVRGLSVLRRALKSTDAENQKLAVAALATPSFGPKAAPAMHDLADVLTNEKNPTMVRRYAALAIAHIGPEAEPVVPALVQALRRDQPVAVRQYVAEAMGQMKWPATAAAMDAILDAIEKDTDPIVRQKCVWSLFPMSRDDLVRTKADKALAKVIEEPAGEMNIARYDAARKLAQALGADAPDKTADVLLHMLQNKMLKVYTSTDASVRGAGTEAAAANVNVKANIGGDARFMAAEALGYLQAKAKARPDVVRALEEAAEDKDEKLQEKAKQALKAIGVKE
ncbi:MAG TPA: HEAT repeat domain-containing protein [Gemmataceae bacterium]